MYKNLKINHVYTILNMQQIGNGITFYTREGDSIFLAGCSNLPSIPANHMLVLSLVRIGPWIVAAKLSGVTVFHISEKCYPPKLKEWIEAQGPLWKKACDEAAKNIGN